MALAPDPRALLAANLAEARARLRAVDADAPSEALPDLRAAVAALTDAIDEAIALAVLKENLSIRAAAQLAGLSENAVGPRLARTSALAAYGEASGRVSARGVERARYDVERGDWTPSPPAPPMRFRARRND